MSSSASTWIQRKLASLPPIRTDSKRSKPGVTSSEASPFSPPSSKWLSSFSAHTKSSPTITSTGDQSSSRTPSQAVYSEADLETIKNDIRKRGEEGAAKVKDRTETYW